MQRSISRHPSSPPPDSNSAHHCDPFTPGWKEADTQHHSTGVWALHCGGFISPPALPRGGEREGDCPPAGRLIAQPPPPPPPRPPPPASFSDAPPPPPPPN